MKLPFFFIIFIILIVSCKREKPALAVNQELTNTLQLAVDLRFEHPEEVDTLLHGVYAALKNENSDELWAKYYFVKAHVELVKNKYTQSILLLDSATRNEDFKQTYQDKINLSYVLIYELSLLYKTSLEYHKRIDIAQAHLSNNEKIITLFSRARIANHLRKSTDSYLARADSLVKHGDDIDLGLYYSNKAFFAKNINKQLEYNKKSYEYAQLNNDGVKAFRGLCLLAHNYVDINLDSATFYLTKARELKNKQNLGCLIDCTEKGIFYHIVWAKLYHKKHLYTLSNTKAQLAIKQSIQLNLEDKIYYMYQLMSKNHFALGEYTTSNECLNHALTHRLAYSTRITSRQINIDEAKERLDKLKQENIMYAIIYRNEQLKNRAFLAYSLILSGIAILLFYNRKRIKGMLHGANNKIQKKDITILHYQNTVEHINQHVHDEILFDKTKLSKIRQAIENDSKLSSWEVINEIYQHKYPEGEILIRKGFPDLKAKDYQHLMCMHLGLSPEKMANIFNIQKNSVRKRTNRIKICFKIPPEADLKEVILDLF